MNGIMRVHQVSDRPTGSFNSALSHLARVIRRITQLEEPLSLRSQANQTHRTTNQDSNSVIFVSNEFVSVHLLTECYEGER